MTTPDQGAARPNRGPAAAAGNRRALLAAAREIFAEDGPPAAFSAVARRAGVGQGTLYRHFPDRIALAVAVFEENIDALEAALGGEGGSVSALLALVAEQAATSTAIIRLLAEDDERAAVLSRRFRALVDDLLRRDREAGRIGAHVETADVEIATSMIAHELASTRPPLRGATALRARRLFDAAFAPR